jgi:hypothetical protein
MGSGAHAPDAAECLAAANAKSQCPNKLEASLSLVSSLAGEAATLQELVEHAGRLRREAKGAPRTD